MTGDSFLRKAEIIHRQQDGYRRVSIETDPEFGIRKAVDTENVTMMSPSAEMTIRSGEDCVRATSPSDSQSILPKKRRIQKQIKITDSVLQSRAESTRISDMLAKGEGFTPTIKKALKERANFYRRKLNFYENLGVLAISMTSEEMKQKQKEDKEEVKMTDKVAEIKAMSQMDVTQSMATNQSNQVKSLSI